tara:strand:+ start:455 stop:835 length:381 start_codon:yes stop_codon:yes gene_type:complete
MLGVANPVGVGQTINYAGDRVYGYSGLLSVGPSAVDLLKFETGSELIVAEFQFFASSNDSEVYKFQVEIDGQIIAQFHSEGRGSSDREHGVPIPVVIAPFTKVKAIGTSSGGTKTVTCLMTGKIVG